MFQEQDELARLIGRLERHIDTTSDTLPEAVFLFVSRLTPLVNVDLLIRDASGRTLLTWRRDEFYGPGWHVPGGVIRYKENASERIRQVASRELGATVAFDPSPLFVDEGIAPMRRNRGHFVSLLYRCRLLTAPDEHRRCESRDPLPGEWRWHVGCPANLIPEQQAYAAFMA
jgi:colanic acid biosynthesis protein WcaH